ncbi:dihydropteroate synthase [Arthrobacter crystallopoietes BAB-32]|uniref:Dihydropteroate synthase n=1 Tax=Arthrobacter crystallopoietes BAB-32 TaxID=1246476 RepID=N1V0F0_9MICC|nr:dihydropteroate synthase [Arthrobacter crystallopoietes]EMY33514.1 dihydropteroate synthase [Arthrobacter crystallopoietes BAB-32]
MSQAALNGAYLPALEHPVHSFGARRIDFSRQVALMAIVNRTPDSFYDGGATFGLDAAVSAALRAVDDGADWVDIGGVPFAPGPALSAAEEAERIVPVIEAVRSRSDVVISADTFLPEVAQASIAAGANVINDTTGLRNKDLAAVVAEAGAHIVITHSLAAPRTVYPRPQYEDVVPEVADFLRRKTEEALALGIAADKIIVDPGHDLNKNTLHSLEITRRFSEIADLGFPALAAVSNKDFIGETLDQDKKERLAGSLAAAVMCIMNGARIVRMHNVAEAHSAVRLVEAALGWRQPAYLKHNMGDFNEPARG